MICLREEHVFEIGVEKFIGGDSVKSVNVITMLGSSEHIKHLIGLWIWERSHMDELNQRRFLNCHRGGTTKLEIVSLLVLLPRGFPSFSKLVVYSLRFTCHLWL